LGGAQHLLFTHIDHVGNNMAWHDITGAPVCVCVCVCVCVSVCVCECECACVCVYLYLCVLCVCVQLGMSRHHCSTGVCAYVRV
jgi:hypothetical protein